MCVHVICNMYMQCSAQDIWSRGWILHCMMYMAQTYNLSNWFNKLFIILTFSPSGLTVIASIIRLWPLHTYNNFISPVAPSNFHIWACWSCEELTNMWLSHDSGNQATLVTACSWPWHLVINSPIFKLKTRTCMFQI